MTIVVIICYYLIIWSLCSFGGSVMFVRDWKVRLTTQIMLQTHPQKVLGSIGIWNDLWKLIMFRCNLWIHNLCTYHIYTHIWYVPCTLIDISPGYGMITFWLCMIFLELYLVVNEIILCLIMFIYFWEGVESKNLRFRWFSKNLMLFFSTKPHSLW